MSVARWTGCSFNSSGPGEFQETVQHLVEPPDLLADDVDVLGHIGRRTRNRLRAGGRAPSTAPRGDRLPCSFCLAAPDESSSRSAGSSLRARRRPSADRARPACASSSASNAPGSSSRCCARRASRPGTGRRCPRSRASSASRSAVSAGSSPEAVRRGSLRLAAGAACARQSAAPDFGGQAYCGRRPAARSWPCCRRSARRAGENSATASSRLSITDSRSVGPDALGGRICDRAAERRQLRADGFERAAEIAKFLLFKSSVTSSSPRPSRDRPLWMT